MQDYDRKYRRLVEKLGEVPQASLGLFPTPLQPMNNYGRLVGHDELFIKRDDLTGLGLGGNKTRSLRFLLGEARQRGADVVIVAGALQSNLCTQAAAAASRLGMECLIVHNDDRPGLFEGNMLLNAMLGAEQRFVGPVGEDERSALAEEFAVQLRETGKRVYMIANSSSTPRGSLGYVSAAAELFRQCSETGIRMEHVAIPGAMAGTASGLVAGAALLGGPFRVHVINVEYPGDTLKHLIDGYTAGIFDILDCHPDVDIEETMTIHHHALGGGYGQSTADSMRALYDLARTEGIFTEIVYTSKTLAGLAELIRDGTVPSDEPACFWHTGGTGALFAQGEEILGGGDGQPADSGEG